MKVTNRDRAKLSSVNQSFINLLEDRYRTVFPFFKDNLESRHISIFKKRKGHRAVAALILMSLYGSSTIFPIDVYATQWGNQPSNHAHDRRHDTHKAADQDAVRQFTQFTDNLEAGRFALDQTPFTLLGEAPGSDPDVPWYVLAAGAAVAAAFIAGIAYGCATANSDEATSDCIERNTLSAVAAVSRFAGEVMGTASKNFETGKDSVQQDPQVAVLLDSFQLNGVDVHGQLIARATSADSVIFRKQLTNFLGGGTFIGSKAFGGSVLDSTGQPIPGAVVRIGVFIKNDGTMLLVPITFFARLADINKADRLEWDLDPIVSSGIFKTTGVRLFATEPGASLQSITTPSN